MTRLQVIGEIKTHYQQYYTIHFKTLPKTLLAQQPFNQSLQRTVNPVNIYEMMAKPIGLQRPEDVLLEQALQRKKKRGRSSSEDSETDRTEKSQDKDSSDSSDGSSSESEEKKHRTTNGSKSNVNKRFSYANETNIKTKSSCSRCHKNQETDNQYSITTFVKFSDGR
eukprot:UN00049